MSWFRFKCRECGCEFDEPHIYEESHGFTDGPFERWSECPNCESCDYGDAQLVEQEEARAFEIKIEGEED